VPLNEWSHIAAVCDVENQKVALYLNSEIDQTAPLRVKEILPVGKTLSIGAHGGGPKFAGIMDEVRIYARALSETEIKERYKGKEIEDSQLCLYFDFNEGEGKILHDKSGNKKDGVLIGFSPIAQVPGKYGKAFRFTGQFIEIPDSKSLQIKDKITIEMWLRLLPVPGMTLGGRTVLSKASTDWRMCFWSVNDKLSLSFWDRSIKTPYAQHLKIYDTYFELNEWCHIVSMYDGSILKGYVNGELVSTRKYRVKCPITTVPGPLRLGKWVDREPRYLCGDLDEFRVYKRALSEEEVKKRYMGKEIGREGLVLELTMDKIENNIVKDTSGYGNDGKILGDSGGALREFKRLISRKLSELRKSLSTTSIEALHRTTIEKSILEIEKVLKEIDESANYEEGIERLKIVNGKILKLKERIKDIGAKTNRLKVISLTREIFKVKEPLFGVAIESPMKKVLRNGENLGDRVSDTVSLSLARNEHEGFQLVVVPSRKDLEDLSVEITDLVQPSTGKIIPRKNITINYVGYVGVVEGCKRGGYTFQIEYSKVNKKPIKYLPDPLLEKEKINVSKDLVQPVWVDIFAPPETAPGNYYGTISVKAKGVKEMDISLSVRVYNFALPERFSLPTYFNVMPDKGALTSILSDHRLSTGWLDNESGRGGPIQEFSEIQPEIEKQIKKYQELGGTQFMIIVPQMKLGKKLGDYPPPQRRYMKRFLKDYAKFLEKKGLLDKAYIWVWDEPGPYEIPYVKELMRFVKEINPRIRILQSVTEDIPPELCDEVDIWCSSILAVDRNLETLNEWRQKKKENELWYYVACNPAHYYPNFFVDEEHTLIGVRLLLGFMAWKYNIQGFLYYWARGWHGSSFIVDKETSTCYWKGWSRRKNPAGDGLLVYPGEWWTGWGKGKKITPEEGDKILSSIRLEAIRDGIEDYEYFILLKERIQLLKKRGGDQNLIRESEKLLTVPEEIVASFTNYTNNPSRVYSQRELIASQIEKIDSMLKKEQKRENGKKGG
ncbi:DUF4091 domain-containing protein, partial [Candidatus Calescamantes bacterium]|nr:DUF4091 domain-containing protein [Candidatus Calescamantes bacterium]